MTIRAREIDERIRFKIGNQTMLFHWLSYSVEQTDLSRFRVTIMNPRASKSYLYVMFLNP